MAALTDNLSQVAVAGSQTTLAAPGKAVGATSINLTAAAGWPTATGVIFAMRRVNSNGVYQAGTYTEWAGVLSGTAMTLGVGTPSPLYGTDQVYAADGLTQVYIPVSSSWANRLINALLLDHAQNGGHNTLHDLNGNTLLGVSAVASAVNSFILSNQITGSGPSLNAQGSDSAVDGNLSGKGTGRIYTDGAAPGPLAANVGGGIAWVESGCVITNPSGLNYAMSAGVVWVNGKRYNVAAITSTALTASKDNYIDVLVGANQNTSSQSVVVTTVTNNAASPALAANSIRIGIAVAGASTISTINQGGVLATGPTYNSCVLMICDSNGNLIYNTKPNPKLVGFRYYNSGFTVGSGSGLVAITGMSCPVLVPANGTVKAGLRGRDLTNNSTGVGELSLWRTSVSGTQMTGGLSLVDTTTAHYAAAVDGFDSPAAGIQTYVAGLQATANNVSFETFVYMFVELD